MMKKIKPKIKNWKLTIFAKQSGFTVLESIVAIAILSLSIAGAFSVIQQNLSISIISKDEVKAFYLAQEAVEIIRNKRDNNQLAYIAGHFDTNWLTGIASKTEDPCYFGKTCVADAKDFSLRECSGSCEKLRQDTSTNMYSYDPSGNLTNFTREIQFESINANEVAVIVIIKWTKGVWPFEFKIKTTLMDWK